MARVSNRYTIWHWFGMISAFIILILISFTLYRYLEKSKGPRLLVTGECHNFTMIPYLDYSLDNNEEILQLDTLCRMINSEDTEAPQKVLNYSFYNFSKAYSNYLKKYKTLWIFDLSNEGSELISDIFIELPGKGKYLVNQSGLESTFTDFDKRIAINDLMQGDMATVYAWSEEALPDYSTFNGEQTKVTTRYGVVDISYPVKATGLIAWNIEKDNYPIIIALAVLFVIITILVILFYNIGLRHAKE